MDFLAQKFQTIPHGIKITAIVIIGFYILDGLLGNGFNYPAVVIESALTRDKIINEFACNQQYAWRIVETDRVLKGNKFELGTSAQVQTWRDLFLVSNGKVISDMNPNYVYYWDSFPTGSEFTKAYIYQEPDFYLTNDKETLRNRVLSADLSVLSMVDFEIVSRCLQTHKSTIEEQLSFTDKQFQPIGWLTHGGVSLYDPSSDSKRKTFQCKNEAELITSGPYVVYSTSSKSIAETWHLKKNRNTIGVIGFDGSLIQSKNGINMSQPETSISEFDCMDESGLTFEMFLNSVPERITFLP